MEWISIKNQLPEPNVGVLITDGKTIATAQLLKSQSFSFRSWQYEETLAWLPYGIGGDECEFDFADCAVTHWMPLPELPEKEESPDEPR